MCAQAYQAEMQGIKDELVHLKAKAKAWAVENHRAELEARARGAHGPVPT